MKQKPNPFIETPFAVFTPSRQLKARFAALCEAINYLNAMRLSNSDWIVVNSTTQLTCYAPEQGINDPRGR
jgi:hypothetical protein